MKNLIPLLLLIILCPLAIAKEPLPSVPAGFEVTGFAYAPDLTNLGKRADAKSIAESILLPNAIITEGFHTINVATADGKQLSGFLKQESGLRLDLVRDDGKLVSIRKSEIEARKRVNKSAMPEGMAKQLSPQHVADLIAFVVSYQRPAKQQQSDNKPSRANVPQSWGDPKSNFHFALRGDSLSIRLDGRAVGSYYLRHDRVKRPFFAHVKTTNGVQVTRRFPPRPGEGDDHGDMHPGLWLAFGKLGGADFWRNKGRVVHERFVGEPTAAEAGSFSTINRYETAAGKLICRQTTTYRFRRDPAGYLIDMDARFASDQPFEFGVQEEMGLGMRVAAPLRIKQGNGRIESSTGGRNEAGTWGKVAQWWDYHGVVDNRRAGMMLMSAPGNPPTWAHSRDYGVLVANPFPVDSPANRSIKRRVKPGEKFRLRFGVLVHERAKDEDLDRAAAFDRYREVVAQ
ncbi:MAG: PmoA family protein [Pirellulaceae bacterium]|jgi:putative heme-binding domain-containing protein|nr:PmoA family protein [Pirellulaceae bacterium]MDP7014551.1 PmoA family protein [Pirellulaceae bacterium]